MSTTLEDALEEEAYARMVDDVISAHKDDIISDFVSERMKSYYLKEQPAPYRTGRSSNRGGL